MKSFVIGIILTVSSLAVFGQVGTIKGEITSSNEGLEFVNIQIKGTSIGTITDMYGRYRLENVPYGQHSIVVSFIGYESQDLVVELTEINRYLQLDFTLKEHQEFLDRVVITGTRTDKRQIESPVIVNVVDHTTLNNVQACNLSEGLKFQPGLRVETDCQTCNYTQLRMNGLGGGYSQILINGRPVFSPLTGLYGMEQIPANMIDRIEVVRGGGSALYGSSAIGGTVNVITRAPKNSSYEANYTYQNINGGALDNIFSGNATLLSSKARSGMSVFINNRIRNYYDHNGDNFSELPALRNNSFGTNFFFLPTNNQKLEVSLSSIHEYRYGGEMVDLPSHQAEQSEERKHNVLISNIDYQINFNDDNSSLIAYLAAQNTDRDHYTGILPDGIFELANHMFNPPYGTSSNTTFQAGVQYNHRFMNFLGGQNVVSAGSEYIFDDIYDVIEAYNYKIDQVTKNFGFFLQSDWEITPDINLLTGARADKHNMINKVVASPRVSLLYKLKTYTQFRLTWGMGFRAPQAFDADMHIAFAGGGVSRISLSPILKEERSNSVSASVNYDKPTEKYIIGYTVEAFYTYLKDAFYLHSLGEDGFGEQFEKRNGIGATVNGVTLELRANYNKKAQLESGFTMQTSQHEEPVQYLESLDPKKDFLRTPNLYGYSTLTLTPNEKINASANLVYTGKMELLHFAGAPEQTTDEYVNTSSFTDLSIKSGYTFPLKKVQTAIEVYGGVKNIFNSYQSDFDTGKNRDSGFVYGPGLPHTFFFGLKIKSLGD